MMQEMVAAGSVVCCIADLPDGSLEQILSFLHGLLLTGWPGAASRTWNAVCSQDDLCARALARDLAPEERGMASRQFNLVVGRGEAVRELRAMAEELHGKSPATIAYMAAVDGRPSLLAWAGQRTELHSLDGSGRSALMLAASRDKPRTCGVAIAAGCVLEQQLPMLGSALHMAAYAGSAEVVRCLCVHRASLEARTDPEVRDRDGLDAAALAHDRSPGTTVAASPRRRRLELMEAALNSSGRARPVSGTATLAYATNTLTSTLLPSVS